MKAKNSNSKASKFSSDKAGGLVNTLPLAKDCKIVLTANIWPEAGLINGSQGFVRYIIFSPGKVPPNTCLPELLICHFPEYKGPDFLEGQPGTVPIYPVRREWYEKKGTTLLARRMLPLLLGYSLTIHKSQGKYLTL